VAIHDINMNPVGSSGFNLLHGFSHTGKVR
jgi:hypothetical protein